jgi:hypothetical protein
MPVERVQTTFWCQRPGCYVEKPLPKYTRRDRPGGIYCSRRCSMLAAGMKRRGTFDFDENSNEECPDVSW